MFLAPHVQYDGLIILVSRDGDHAGLAVVPVHGYGGVAPVLKSKKKMGSDFYMAMSHNSKRLNISIIW